MFKLFEGLSLCMCIDVLRLKGLVYGIGELSLFSRLYERIESMNLKYFSIIIVGMEYIIMMKVDV